MTKTTILTEVASVKALKTAWQLLNKSNRDSRGISSITIKNFEDRLDSNLEKLSTELLSGKFRFSPVRGTTIKKKNLQAKLVSPQGHLKNLRPLRIPEIKDRVVHKALAIAIESHISHAFNLKNDSSFAYQKGKGIENAILKMGMYFNTGYKIILEADIIKFFDTINSLELIKKVQTALPDDSINTLLADAVKQQIGNIDELKSKKVFELYFENSEAGIPQGNALSPLLANVYLSSFDEKMSTSGFKLIRYADDFIVMCKTFEEAGNAYEIALDELQNKLNLKLHPLGADSKTRIVDPRQHEFSFLSVRFDGEKFTIHPQKLKEFFLKLKCLVSKQSRSELYPNEEIGLFQALTKLKNLTDGWIAAYYFLDCDRQIDELDKFINILLVQIFEDFGLSLKKNVLVEESLKGQRRKNLALSLKQRKATGIKLCTETLNKVRDGISPLRQRIQELLIEEHS
ncbi:group II intron reverse transcriptase/maturase [Mucilaginibacter gynuensis]|uniref:Group II intron reverse transcriptase/maturase n=1 Tax=Mucilaginibacter gynuensis TaxID=1302236 RepID=A0ABP8G504_9SPHI